MYESEARLQITEENFQKNLDKLTSLKTMEAVMDIDEYLKYLEKEIKPDILNSRKTINEIIKLLDEKLTNLNKTFNRTLFMHILEFSGLKSTNEILLSDFFRSYFQVYESMRINHEKFGNECIRLSNELDKLKAKLSKEKAQEKILESGLTTNSTVMFDLKSIKPLGINQYLDTKLRVELNSNSQELDLNEINLKRVVRMPMERLNSKLIVTILQLQADKKTLNTIPLEVINVREIHERTCTRTYQIANFGEFSINYIWINSRVNYINNSSNELEIKKEDCQFNFELLDKSIKLLQEPFPLLSEAGVFLTEPKKEYAQHLSYQSNTMEGLTTKNQIEYSEKIDNFIGKLVGHQIIVWENILFFMNRILIMFVSMTFFYKCDYVSVLYLNKLFS
jgi:hypothetical protein